MRSQVCFLLVIALCPFWMRDKVQRCVQCESVHEVSPCCRWTTSNWIVIADKTACSALHAFLSQLTANNGFTFSTVSLWSLIFYVRNRHCLALQKQLLYWLWQRDSLPELNHWRVFILFNIGLPELPPYIPAWHWTPPRVHIFRAENANYCLLYL